jgi:predicted dehydrogenase
MSEKILNWGLLSTARINHSVIPPLRESKRNQLLAVASRSGELAQKFSKKWKIQRTHASYEDLLADPDIDVIYNPLPNHLHAEWTVKAVEAGKHVLCEKPLALNVEEVDAIAGAAKTHGRVVAEAFMYRHHPQTLKVQEMIDNGSIGTLKLLRGSFSFYLDREGDIRLDPAKGGGSIWDIGCYPISFMRTVVGAEPVEVFGWQVTGPTGIDATFVGQLHFAGDVYGQFDSSFVIPFHTHIEIVGSEATLVVPNPFKPGLNEKIYLMRNGKSKTIKVKGETLYLGEVEDMTDAINLGKAPRISLEDSRANVAVIQALLESARLNKPVKI